MNVFRSVNVVHDLPFELRMEPRERAVLQPLGAVPGRTASPHFFFDSVTALLPWRTTP